MDSAHVYEQLDTLYPLLRKKLILYFTGRKISPAEDYADEVIERVLKKISEGEQIENINAFTLGVAKFVFLEACRKPHTVAINSAGEIETEIDGDISGKTVPKQLIIHPVSQADENIYTYCLRKALAELPEEKRLMLLAYYSISENSANYIDRRKQLADRYGLRLETLYTAVCRLRKKIAESINKHLNAEAQK